MGNKGHIAVIGAGTVGLSTAMSLLERGAKVTVLEADHPASGSSGRSIGVVGTQHVDDLKCRMMARSYHRMMSWKPHGFLFNHIGYLRLGRTERDLALFRKSREVQVESGLPDARLLDPAAIRKLVPPLSTHGLLGAIFGPNDGFVDPYQMCSVLVAMVRGNGGEVRQRCRVTGAARKGGVYRLALSSGTLDCDGVVIAAGAWADRVAAMFGSRLTIRPERHQAFTLHLPEPLPYTMPMVQDWVDGGSGTGLNFRHDRQGELIIEAHRPGSDREDPDSYDQGVDEPVKAFLAEQLLERAPDLAATAGFGRGWAGLYPCSADGRPLIGPIDAAEPMLVAAAGAGGYGIQLAPILGELAAEWMTEGAPVSMPEAVVLRPTAERN